MRISIDAVKEKEFRGTLIVLLFLINTSALGAGYFFMEDPSGKSLGFSLAYIQFSPFTDYFWPGWILFLTIGIYGLMCFLLIVFRHRYYPLYMMLLGVILIGWISIQIIMVRDFNLLHAMCIAIGFIFCITGKIIIQ